MAGFLKVSGLTIVKRLSRLSETAYFPGADLNMNRFDVRVKREKNAVLDAR